MREIYGAIARRLRDEESFAVATLIATRGAKASAVGTSLVVGADGSFAGDIGAGCHEGRIVERALAMLGESRTAPVRLCFELDDELLAGTGCGASLDVVVWRPQRDFEETAQAIAAGERDVTFDLEGATIVVARRPRLLVVGATALAAELTALAQRADYVVTVVDPRPPFATRERHPGADELLLAWPDDSVAVARAQEAGAIVIVSHDVKLDLPALRTALASFAAYVGILGNRRVQAARRAALRAEGYEQAQIGRIRGPAGLDLGGVTDGETAVSILAEMLAVQRERSGEPLSRSDGPIHPSTSSG